MTAMDDHFAGDAVSEADAAHGDDVVATPAAKDSLLTKIKSNGHLIIGALVFAIGGATIYNRNFGGQEVEPTSVAGLEVVGAPAEEPAPLVVNAPTAALSASGASDVPEQVASGPGSQAVSVAHPNQVTAGAPAAPEAPQIQQQMHTQGAAPAVAQVPPAAVQQPDSQEVSLLRKELASVKARAASLEEQVRALQEKLRSQQISAPAQKPVATKPAVKPAPAPAQKQSPAVEPAKSNPRPVAAPAAPAASTASTVTPVPSRYRVYAMRENMAWIQDSQSRETIPAPVGATLPDGSRVVSLDEAAGVVQTTSGTIRYGSGRGN